MSVQITIRDVPEAVRDELACRAAREGKSMQEYLKHALDTLASRPSPEQWVAMVKESKAHYGSTISAETIVEELHKDKR